MMRRPLFLMALSVLAIDARATLPVVDYTHIGTDAVHQIVNVAHYAATEANTLNTYLNAVKQYEAQIVGLTRMGDMSALRSLPGIGTVAELAGTTGQLYRDYQQLQQVANPQGYQSDMQRVLGNYSMPSWQGFLAANGTQIQPNANYYQWDTARWNLAGHFGDVLQQLQQQRAALQAQRDEAERLAESATDQAQHAKYAAQVANLDQAIAQVDQQVHQAMAQNTLQTQRIYAGQQVSQAAQFEQGSAAQYQSVDRDLSQLPSNSFRAPVHFSN
jgi:P-type conjugative transfer protein TrbJ